MAHGRFAVCLLSWKIHFRTRKQKYRSKNWTRCKIAWKTNEYISQFNISATELRFEGELAALNDTHKEKGLFCQNNQPLGVWKNRQVLQSKQKQLKNQENKPNACVTLTSKKLKLLYKKGFLGMCSPEVLLNTLWLNNTLHSVGARNVAICCAWEMLS